MLLVENLQRVRCGSTARTVAAIEASKDMRIKVFKVFLVSRTGTATRTMMSYTRIPSVISMKTFTPSITYNRIEACGAS